MSKKQENLELIGVGINLGQSSKCTLLYENTFPCFIEFQSSELGNHSFQAKDLFECLSKLRLFLEAKDWRILCNGSRIDAYPSTMSRQMGGGAKSYPLRIGEQPKRSELLNIFDRAEPEKIGTVNQQQNYYKQWVQSISKNIN